MLYDVIVIGGGMGGMTAAALLSDAGLKTIVLEAAHLPGGCSSSYKKRGGVFETGATTLIGFDPHQPLRYLADKLHLEFPINPIEPSMKVILHNGKELTRYQNLDKWIQESSTVFGQSTEQEKFWRLAKRISDTVWKVSLKNSYFPPLEFRDWVSLAKNDPRDIWILPYAFKSVTEICSDIGITNPDFLRFLDEQLLISAQSVSKETPMIFGAPALTYTNYTNYYSKGGLLEFVRVLQRKIEDLGSEVKLRRKVIGIEALDESGFKLYTKNGESYRAKHVVSNIPIWDMPSITNGAIQAWFEKYTKRYSKAWGALTFGILIEDHFPDNLPLHTQLHVPSNETIPGSDSRSIFVSISLKGDELRAEKGLRTLNISTHVSTEEWFSIADIEGEAAYQNRKKEATEAVLSLLDRFYLGFDSKRVKEIFAATPVTWQNWVHRYNGRVGGIPQELTRSLLDWTPAKTPFKGLYLCGDTVYPGQGIPGVTLSGINVYSRIIRDFK